MLSLQNLTKCQSQMDVFHSHWVGYSLFYIAVQPQTLPNHYTNKEKRLGPTSTTACHINWGQEVINDNQEAMPYPQLSQ